MAITVTAIRDTDRFEGAVRAAADRYQVIERNRATGADVGVRERFGDRRQASIYAHEYTQREPALFGESGAYSLVVRDAQSGVQW